MAVRREQDALPGLDSLMDTVFNVVAILILIVLVGAMMSESTRSQIREQIKPSGGDDPVPKEEDLAKLAQQVALVEEDVRRLELEIAGRKRTLQELTRIHKLEGQVEDLEKLIKILQARLKDLELESEKLTAQVPETTHRGRARQKLTFRPPYPHKITQTKPLMFWCERDQLFLLDPAKVPKMQLQVGVRKVVPIPGTSFSLHHNLKDAPYYVHLRLNAGATGIPLQAVQAAGGDPFRQIVERSNKRVQFFMFAVYPTGFKSFRLARRIVREKGFELNWELFAANEYVNLFGGGGGSGTMMGK